MKKTKRTIEKVMIAFLCVCIILCAGCGKKNRVIQVYQYEENEDGTLKITGLTDKGKNDSKLTVPAEWNGKKVTAIDAGAFQDDRNVTEIVISDGVERIGDNAFMLCKNLTEVTIPESVNRVGMNVFTDTAWENAQYENHTEIVVNSILIGVRSGMSEYTVPGNVKRIAAGVFYNNAEIKKVTISQNLETIGDYAFSGCTQLTELTLPDSIQSIGYAAFSDCEQLQISVPAGVREIGTDAFRNVKQLQYTGSLSGKPWGAKAVS